MLFMIFTECKIDLIVNWCIHKKHMADIIEQNTEIIQKIRDIYQQTEPLRLRTLIEKHFIPPQKTKINKTQKYLLLLF